MVVDHKTLSFNPFSLSTPYEREENSLKIIKHINIQSVS